MFERLRRAFRAPTRPAPKPRRRPQLGLEQLEERAVPAVINVISLADNTNPVVAAGHAGTTADPFLAPSLRSAISFANGNAGGNTINLAVAGTYKITIPGIGEDNNATGDFDILPTGGNLSIINTSGGQATVDGNHLNRVFDINPGNTDNPLTKFTVTLQGFTITNGVAVDPGNLDGPGSSDGGVRDQGNASLTLNNVTITRNTASADGGGVSMENGVSTPWTLTVNDSVISFNHAGDAGGGIETDGAGKVFVNAGTVITGNTSNNQGGGIWLDATQDGVGDVTVNTGGAGYSVADTVTFSAPQNAGGTTATGVAVITGGVVTGVTITNPGSGYTSAPTITFNSATGTGATATPNLDFFNSANLTVTGTLISDNAALNVGLNDGGGVGNAGGGTVKLLNSSIMYNSTGGIGGGYGFFAGQATGALQVFDSIIVGNYAAGGGGGIATGGTTSLIVSSILQSNSTAGRGGAISATGGQLLLENSVVAGNASQSDGGGIDVETSGTGANASVIVNSTIAFNSAVNANGGQIGGGIDVGNAGGFTGALTLLNDTINGNYAITGGGANASMVAVNVQNTIIAGNNATNVGPDTFGTNGFGFTSLGGNIVGVNSNGNFSQASDQVGVDPLLGPLQDNGGPAVGDAGMTNVLFTEAFRRGSPALGKGVSTLANMAPTVDARGFVRPDVAGEAVDVGAFELEAGAPNAFFYVGTDHSLHQSGVTAALSPATTILSASAVTDNAGNDAVYAITAFGHQLWEHTPAGWVMLSPNSYQQIAAATNAGGYPVVFAVGTDESLTEFTPAGSILLSPATTILSISAVTDAFGNDDVFAVTSDNHLWEHTPAGWQMRSAGSFQQISAGLNTAGQAEAFAVLNDNSLWENNPANPGDGWAPLSGAGTALSVSTGAADTAFVILANHQLKEYQLGVGTVISGGNFAQISGTQNAAGQAEVFAVLGDSSLWEYNPAFAGDHWMNLLTPNVLSVAAPLRR